MKRARQMPVLIAADVELVEGELAKLHAVQSLMASSYAEWLAQRGPAEAAAVERLTTAGGRIVRAGDTTRFRFRGLAASSTCGLQGAFQNWMVGARRKLGEPVL